MKRLFAFFLTGLVSLLTTPAAACLEGAPLTQAVSSKSLSGGLEMSLRLPEGGASKMDAGQGGPEGLQYIKRCGEAVFSVILHHARTGSPATAAEYEAAFSGSALRGFAQGGMREAVLGQSSRILDGRFAGILEISHETLGLYFHELMVMSGEADALFGLRIGFTGAPEARQAVDSAFLANRAQLDRILEGLKVSLTP